MPKRYVDELKPLVKNQVLTLQNGHQYKYPFDSQIFETQQQLQNIKFCWTNYMETNLGNNVTQMYMGELLDYKIEGWGIKVQCINLPDGKTVKEHMFKGLFLNGQLQTGIIREIVKIGNNEIVRWQVPVEDADIRYESDEQIEQNTEAQQVQVKEQYTLANEFPTTSQNQVKITANNLSFNCTIANGTQIFTGSILPDENFNANYIFIDGFLTLPNNHNYNGKIEQAQFQMQDGQKSIWVRRLKVCNNGDYTLYCGEYVNHIYEGWGIMQKQVTVNDIIQETVYQGELVNGEYHGQGRLMAIDGTVIFEGQFTNGSWK